MKKSGGNKITDINGTKNAKPVMYNTHAIHPIIAVLNMLLSLSFSFNIELVLGFIFFLVNYAW